MLGFFPIQKNTIQKNTIQKIAIQKIAIHFFPYKKLLCSAHIQKITMYSHTQKITYKKKC